MQRLPSRKRGTGKAKARLTAVAAIAVAGSIATATAVVAGPASAKTARASKAITLQFWSSYNVADKEESTFANVIVKKFEKENPGIKVVATAFPYSDLLSKMLSSAAAGDPRMSCAQTSSGCHNWHPGCH